MKCKLEIILIKGNLPANKIMKKIRKKCCKYLLPGKTKNIRKKNTRISQSSGECLSTENNFD